MGSALTVLAGPIAIRWLVILATVAGCVALPAGAQARVPADFIGMASEDVFAGDPEHRTANLSAMAAIGVGSLRQTFDWSTIESSPGQYDLSFHDDYVAKAAAHGIKILPVLFNAPLFHARRPVSRPAYPPKSNATMAQFAQLLVRRYGPRGTLWQERPDVPRRPITAWQIWNEPSLRAFWGGRPSATGYARMLRTVGNAIERVDRRAEIVTAGLPPSKLRGAVRLGRYIKQLYRAGGRGAFDTLAINSYATNHRELGRLLRSVRRIMNGRGARDRRAAIWITELGWGDRGPRHRFVVGAAAQASRITKSYALIRSQRRRLRLRGAVYFSWRDAAPYPPRFRDLWGLHTGLLNIGGNPKRAFFAFKKAVRRIR